MENGAAQHQSSLINLSTGSLLVLEFSTLPWAPKRSYFLTNTPINHMRGMHAHKTLKQYFVSIQGEWKIEVDDGELKSLHYLKNDGNGLLLNSGCWREIIPLSEYAVLGVWASAEFDEEDYIRDYKEFLLWKSKQKEVG